MEDLDALVGRVLQAAEGRELPNLDTSEPGWFGEALGVAADLAGDTIEDPDKRAGVLLALEGLGQIAPALDFLRGDGMDAFLRLVYEGNDTEMQRCFRYYLEERATYAQRRAIMQAGTQGALVERTRREVVWESALAILRDIGEATLRLLVPLVMAAL